MIIESQDELKKIIQFVSQNIQNTSSKKIKISKIYHEFANSLGFKSNTGLIASLPIWAGSSEDKKSFCKRASENLGIRVSTSVIDEAFSTTKPFPVVAPQNSSVAIRVDWIDGEVYGPFIQNDHPNSSSWPEFYRREAVISLGQFIDKDEYNVLMRRIMPIIERISEEVQSHATEEQTVFSSYGEKLIEEIHTVVESFRENKSHMEPNEPYDFFEESLNLENQGVVILDGLEISQKTKKRDINRMVAVLALSQVIPISCEDIFDYISHLRANI